MSTQTLSMLEGITLRLEKTVKAKTPAPSAKAYHMTNIEKLEKLTTKLNTVEEQELRWQKLLKKGGVAIAILKPDGTYSEANEKYCELIGRGRDEVIGRHWRELRTDIPAEQLQVFEEFVHGKRDDYSTALKYKKPDGTCSYMIINAAAVRGAEDQLLYLMVTARDIEESVKAWQQLTKG